MHKVAGLYRDGTLSGEEKARAKDILIQESISALRNIGKLEIPPPPSSSSIDEPAPSWSPPPASKKSIQSTGTASFFQRGDYEKANNEQNKMVEPPPGMARRPSMTVPWMVAESVLDTPQGSARKTFNVGGDDTPPGGGSAARRGSFENAAEFFKFRRRSKSRLDFARDVIQGDGGGGQMPGIAEVDWTSEETRSKTDSFDKLMNRTWYAIGGSKLFMNGKMEIFWEINMWKPGKEKQLGNSFTNHTLTQEIQKGRVGKKVDHGIWKGKVKKDKAGGTFAGLQPVMYSCCGLPFNVPMFAKWDFMNFPPKSS